MPSGRRPSTPKRLPTSSFRREQDILAALSEERLNQPLSASAFIADQNHDDDHGDQNNSAKDQSQGLENLNESADDKNNSAEDVKSNLRVPQRSSFASILEHPCPEIDVSARETESPLQRPNAVWHSRRPTLENAEVLAGLSGHPSFLDPTVILLWAVKFSFV